MPPRPFPPPHIIDPGFFPPPSLRHHRSWMSAAANQIEGVLRHSMNAFKANWRFAKYRRNTRTAVFRCAGLRRGGRGSQ